MAEWINVNDRLPEFDDLVLVMWYDSCGDDCYRLDRCLGDRWYIDHCDEEYLYWMPLPEPPKE